MCCDGVLFHSVELQPGDQARALAAQGFKLRRRKGRQYFLQPCAAHCGDHCAVYEQRPARCRLFNCRQILRVDAGKSTEADALEKIREARARISRVNALIDALAETNPKRSLAQRCANALTTDERTPLHDELAAAMRALEDVLDSDFRTKDPASSRGDELIRLNDPEG